MCQLEGATPIRHVHPEAQNMTSFRQKLFAGVRKGRVCEAVLLDEGGPPSKDRVLLRDTRGDPDTGRQRQRRDGGGHQPRATWSPQKLVEAGRTLPWSLCRECGPGTP